MVELDIDMLPNLMLTRRLIQSPKSINDFLAQVRVTARDLSLTISSLVW
jgi:hypothetical protein